MEWNYIEDPQRNKTHKFNYLTQIDMCRVNIIFILLSLEAENGLN